MFKKLLLVGACLFSVSSMAAVDCDGGVEAVKVGEYGNQGGYFIVNVIGTDGSKRDYRLGYHTDSLAQARMNLVSTILLDNKFIKLRFYNENSCSDASLNRSTPSAVYLTKG